MRTTPEYRLVPTTPPAWPTEWSTDQRAVLDHAGTSPLLVRGGPGTGKTALLVELVARRVESGTPLENMVVLTHSRAGAQELRSAIVRRVGDAHIAPRITTMHGLCLWLLERFTDLDAGEIPRLLRAPEQEFRIRELLSGHEVGCWPPELAAASSTRLFASQMRAVLARARQLSLDPADVVALGAGDPVWSAVGGFFEEYLTVLDFEQTLDYAELVHRARLLIGEPDAAAGVGSEIAAVFCDEWAELDDSQLGLIGDLARAGVGLIGFADPQQEVFGFRGAGRSATAWLLSTFDQTEVLELVTNHRAGAPLVAAWHGLAARIPARYAPAPSVATTADGLVRAVVYDDTSAEIGHLAHALRSAHLRESVPWADCAVITRTSRAELGPLARALRAHGVPVEVAGDEIVLADQLAVAPLLLALKVCLADAIDADQAARLLTSPLAGLDSVRLRAVGRRLRAREAAEGRAPRLSSELMAEALCDPSLFGDDPDAAPAQHLGDLLGRVGSLLRGGASVHRLLWELWTGSGWAETLRESALTGRDPRVNADLDALCELFELAAGDNLVGERGVQAFVAELAGQTIGADTSRESDPRGRGVRLLTGHRSKGQHFRRVFVIGVREGNWPKLTRRGSLMEPEMLTESGIGPVDVSGQVAAERRLFYVACSRATEQLIVSGSGGMEGEGEQPSRFLGELGVLVERVIGRPAKPMTLAAMVADLRSTACNPAVSPPLRRAAAARLARLSGLHDGNGRRIAPSADPSAWWGMLEPSGANGSLDRGHIRFVGTDIADILECPRRWFLGRAVRADVSGNAAASLGTVVHLLAQHALTSGITRDEIGDHLEAVWDQIPFEAAWLSASERAEAEAALERLYAWQDGSEHQSVLGVEVPFEIDVQVGDDTVTIAGSVDRLERTADGRLRVVDFKTARSMPTARRIASNEQLGVYQLAAMQGAFDELAPGERRVAGGALVMLRGQDGTLPWPKTINQPSLDDVPHLDAGDAGQPTWVHARLASAVAVTRSGDFRAVSCDSCRFCAFQRGCPARADGPEVVA